MAIRLWERVRRRLRVLFRRSDVESELSDEIRLHLDMESEELMREGMTRDEARREARLRLGGEEQAREAVRAQQVLHWPESIWHDIRYGLRQFRRAPGLFLAVVASLAIGLGANTAMFNLVDALLFRPPGQVRGSGRIVHVPIRSQAEYSSLADSMRSLDLFAYSDSSLVGLGRGEDAVEARMQRVTDRFFSVLGTAPARGREFSMLDEGETTEVAVLNHRFWERYFGRDAGIVGRNLQKLPFRERGRRAVCFSNRREVGR